IAEDALDISAHQPFLVVLLNIFWTEFNVEGSFFEDAVGDSPLPQPGARTFGVVNLVSIDGGCVLWRYPFKHMPILHAGSADERGSNEVVFEITAQVRLVAIKTTVVIAGVTGLRVRSAPVGGRCRIWTLAAGFDDGRIHQRRAFDDVAARFQLGVEQGQELFMQATLNEPLAKAADRGLIRHRLLSAKLDKLLKTQAVLDLLFRLGIAQIVEVLQNHDAQQDADAAGRASASAIGRADARLGLAEIYFTVDGFEHAVGRAALLNGQIKKTRLLILFRLHSHLIDSTPPYSKLLQRFPSGFQLFLLFASPKSRTVMRGPMAMEIHNSVIDSDGSSERLMRDFYVKDSTCIAFCVR